MCDIHSSLVDASRLFRDGLCVDIHNLLVDAFFHSPASKFVSHVLSCSFESFLIFPMSILALKYKKVRAMLFSKKQPKNLKKDGQVALV